MANSVLPFIFFQILMYVVIVWLILYLINKWATNYFEIKREQNELLKDLIKTVDKAIEQKDPMV